MTAALHTALSTANGSSPTRWMLVLHGVFGSGANWRTFARHVMAERPAWGFALVDLRGHGHSPSGEPPHTIARAAADLREIESSVPIAAVLGHSLGGRVALAYAGARLRSGRPLERTVIFDASPGSTSSEGAPSDAVRVLDALRSVKGPVPSRERFRELLRKRGLSDVTVDWLAMSLRREPGGFRLGLDLDVIEELLGDYTRADLWQTATELADVSPLWFVLGGRSQTVTDAERARLQAVCRAHPLCRLRVLPTAGHWIHTDDPSGAAAVMCEALAGSD
jgi:pimeloyl-ACP methyl ester carboxylesterase